MPLSCSPLSLGERSRERGEREEKEGRSGYEVNERGEGEVSDDEIGGGDRYESQRRQESA